MALRVLIGGIVGGVVLFAWGAASHMVFQIGDAGLSQLKSHEEPVLAALAKHVTEPGMYFYPGFGSDNPTEEEQKEWENKYRTGPSGLLIHRPQGGEAMTPGQLGREFGSDVLLALVIGVLLAGATRWRANYVSRVVFVAMLGLLPFLAVNFSYWNWFGFSPNYTLAQLADHVIGFTLAGLVLGAIIKGPCCSATSDGGSNVLST
jgi:hypothetical protein